MSSELNAVGRAAPRSLHVVTTRQRRGAELFALDLTSALHHRGQQADLVALAAGVGNGSMALPIPELGYASRSLRTYWNLRSLALKYDIVVAHGSATLEATAVALAGSRIPVIYKSIGDSAYWVRTTKQRVMTQELLRRTAGVVTLWPGAAIYIGRRYGIAEDKVYVVPNGIDAQRYPLSSTEQRRSARAKFGIDRYTQTFGYVGALSEEKNVVSAINAVSAIPSARLIVAGDGPERHELEAAADNSAPGRVQFLGSVEDVCSVLRAVDVLLLPSRSEGMPNVILQAGLLGTPTVASRVGAIPSMIEDGVTGYLVQPSDDAAFARVTAQAIDSAAETGRAAAEEFQRRFHLSESVDGWNRAMCDTIYRTSASRSKPAGPST